MIGVGIMGGMANTQTAKRASSGRTVHTMKISLLGSKPPIWRRLEVPSSSTLHELHEIIQEAFGWKECHMWVFETPLGEYGFADPELGHGSAASKKLDNVAPRGGDWFRYTYDFGDDWVHDILVEDVVTAEPGVTYPRCLAGRRACPPEDCGGIGGYEMLVEILADPEHDEHEEMLDWLGLDSADEFDPAAFDVAEVNEALSGIGTVLVKG
jgi:Plasmid pRiA4b ORF-3-like protein